MQILEIIKKLYPFDYSIVGKGNDKAIKEFKKLLPFKVYSFKSGRSINEWKIPKEWCLVEGLIKTNNKIIFDAKKKKFGVPKNSKSFKGFVKFKDLKKIGYKSLQYGNHVKWDPVKQTKLIQRELGWKFDEVEGLPPDFWMEKLECRVNGIRDWLKYVKRGYGRTAQSVAREIRLGNMTKEEGKKLVDAYHAKKPKSLEYFLKIMDMTEEEFMKISLKHEISPWNYDESKVTDGKKLHDQEKWEDTPLRKRI